MNLQQENAAGIMGLHKFCISERKLVKCCNNQATAGIRTPLAHYDFLDLCLQGETGTRKTHTAKLIHSMSPRASRSVYSVNRAELSSSLSERELFGHEKGAFTGAIGSKEGRFEGGGPRNNISK